MKKITHEEYIKASEIIELFMRQTKQTTQVYVEYDAKVLVTVRVPKEMSDDEIKEQLKSGYCDFEKDVLERVNLLNMTRLVIDGSEIEI